MAINTPELMLIAHALGKFLNMSDKQAWNLLDIKHSYYMGKGQIDLGKLDLFLFGEDETDEEDQNISEVIEKKYGSEASKFIQTLL
jgi:hypothetical protein